MCQICVQQQIFVSEDDRGPSKLFICPSDGFCTLSKQAGETKCYSPPRSQPLVMNYLLQLKTFFSPFLSPFFLLFLKDNVTECPWASSCVLLLLSSTWFFSSSYSSSSSHISLVGFAGPCRQWGLHMPGPTQWRCTSKGSVLAVAKAQGGWTAHYNKTPQSEALSLLNARLMGSRVMAMLYWWCLL